MNLMTYFCIERNADDWHHSMMKSPDVPRAYWERKDNDARRSLRKMHARLVCRVLRRSMARRAVHPGGAAPVLRLLTGDAPQQSLGLSWKAPTGICLPPKCDRRPHHRHAAESSILDTILSRLQSMIPGRWCRPDSRDEPAAGRYPACADFPVRASS